MLNTFKNDLYKVWLIFPPRLVVPAMFAGLAIVALIIHTLLLSTDRFNWLETSANPAGGSAVVSEPAQPAKAPGE